MGQLCACVINRVDLLHRAIQHEQEALGAGAFESADGWGVGFYQASEVLYKKHPRPLDGPVDWATIFEGVRSHIAIGHLRRGTGVEPVAANVHPFRMRQWLFAHAGEVGAFEAIRERLDESLPDFIRRNIRGDTDSEYVFHLFLSFLHDSGQLSAVDADPGAVTAALRSTTTLLDRLGNEVGAPRAELNMLLTNGRQLYAARRGAPLCFVERDRLPVSDAPDSRQAKKLDRVRYILVASHRDETPPPGYRTLEHGQVLHVSQDMQVDLQSL